MGCFNKIGFISGLPISAGDDTVLIFMLKNKHAEDMRGGVVYSTDWFQPAFLPVYGKYDDYGKIEDIVESTATKYLEMFFGQTIESIIDNVDDLAVGRSKLTDEDIVIKKEICSRLTFGLEHKEVFDKMASDKIVGYTTDYLPKYWLTKMGFTLTNEKNGDQRYKETWTHPALPSGYEIHSDSKWGHLMKDGVQDREHYIYHPSELEKAMLKLNPSYVSSLTEEDKSKCSIDIMLDLSKIALQAAELEMLTDPIMAKYSFGLSSRDLDGYEPLSRYTDKISLSGFERYNDNADEVLKVVDSSLIGDLIRFHFSVCGLNAKYVPSNYGSQEQDYDKHMEMQKLYAKILADKKSERYEDEDEDY